ncbi:MAG TPA: T9SS type A sorting domain-containing protein [Flavipsychrobacter sp.]|nr:T9SS type A sorting domain-containing protein [Flavipsychrobacter sp.]
MATLVVIDSQLDTLSIRRYTDSTLFGERLWDCCVLGDGSLIVAGDQASSYIAQQTSFKAMLMRVDAQGNLIWKQTYQKEAGKSAYITSVQDLGDNRSLVGACSQDIIPMGWTYYYRLKPWFIVIENNNGSVLKDTMFASGYAHGGTIYKAMDGGYYHVGRKDSVVYQDPEAAQNFPAYIAHLDTNFNIDWITTMPYSFQPYLKEVFRPRQLQNGDYLVSGTGLQDGTNFVHGWVARVSSNGAILWSKYFYSQANQYAYLADFIERPDGNIILCGWTRNDTLPAWHGENVWLLGLYASGVVLTGTGNVNSTGIKTMEFDIYPNPASETFYLDVPEPGIAELYDMSGRQVAKYDVPQKGKVELRLDDRIAAGNYLLQFTGGESKMVAGKQLIKK